MESKHTNTIARLFELPPGRVNNVLRLLREDGLIPGLRGGDLRRDSLWAVLSALSSKRAVDAATRAACLRSLTLCSPVDLPATAEGMLTRLCETVSASPVLGDFDVDDGFLHIADDAIVLECLTLSGKRACVRYGAPPPTSPTTTYSIPISTVRELATAIGKTK